MLLLQKEKSMSKSETKPSFFSKFKKGLSLSLKSIKFTWQHKKLIFFPCMTVLLIASSVGIYELVYYQLYGEHISSFLLKEEQSPEKEGSTKNPTEKGELLQFYLVITLVSIFALAFFNVALSYAASQAFVERPVDISKSLSHSIKKLPTILVWTFAAFLVHILLKMMQNKKGEGIGHIGVFLIQLVGVAADIAWGLATFLVIPVIAHENVGAFKSIRTSAHLFRKTFVENIFGSSVLQGLIPIAIWLAMFFCMVVIILIATFFSAIFGGFLGVLFFASSIVFILLMALISGIFLSAAIIVFKTAVYHYAIGKPAGPFSAQEIVSSFEKEKL